MCNFIAFGVGGGIICPPFVHFFFSATQFCTYNTHDCRFILLSLDSGDLVVFIDSGFGVVSYHFSLLFLFFVCTITASTISVVKWSSTIRHSRRLAGCYQYIKIYQNKSKKYSTNIAINSNDSSELKEGSHVKIAVRINGLKLLLVFEFLFVCKIQLA